MEPYFETALGKLYCGDALEVMEEIPPESVDLVVTDPPYGVTEMQWDTFRENEYWEFTRRWLTLVYRLLKDGGQLYVFFAQKRMFEFKQVLIGAGFNFKRMLIWHHPNMVRKFTKKSYVWTYDPVFYAIKGERPKVFHSSFVNKYNVDVFTFALPQSNFTGHKKRVHPTQKPLDLVKIFIYNSSDEGDLVLDPFAGSGTTLLASEMMYRRWIGIEINPEYCDIIKKRFDDELGGIYNSARLL